LDTHRIQNETGRCLIQARPVNDNKMFTVRQNGSSYKKKYRYLRPLILLTFSKKQAKNVKISSMFQDIGAGKPRG
jgi:hypothetical protein